MTRGVMYQIQPRAFTPEGTLTGQPDEQTVRETLEAYKAIGVDQYLIYARSGLEFEYLDEKRLQMCEWFCQQAQGLEEGLLGATAETSS